MYTEESLRDKLIDKLEEEQEKYLNEMKAMGADEILKKVYEINARQEILDYVSYANIEPKEMKALLNTDNLIDRMYDRWIDYDGNFYEVLEYPIEEEIERISDEFYDKDNKSNEQENKSSKTQNKDFER